MNSRISAASLSPNGETQLGDLPDWLEKLVLEVAHAKGQSPDDYHAQIVLRGMKQDMTRFFDKQERAFYPVGHALATPKHPGDW